jgi:hypothetical protein
MTTLTRALNLPEALRLQERLAASGITARIPDEAIVRAYQGAVWITGGLRVEVAQEDLARARAILEGFYCNAPAPAARTPSPGKPSPRTPCLV